MIVNLPMKTSQMLQFIATGGELTFDLKDCRLKPKHAIRYLSYTKVSHSVINYGPELVVEYIRSAAMVGKSSLIEDYKNILCLMVHQHMWSSGVGLQPNQIEYVVEDNKEMLTAHLEVVRALPKYLRTLNGKADPLHNQCLSVGIGVNFARLFDDPVFLSYLLAEEIHSGSWAESRYFADLFQGPFYGGGYLKEFVDRNSENSLIKWASNE